MGIVGKFCDEIATHHPDLTREILRRKFGDVGDWYDFTVSKTHPCGCLIGTVAICLQPGKTDEELEAATEVVARLVDCYTGDEIHQIGYNVCMLRCRYTRSHHIVIGDTGERGGRRVLFMNDNRLPRAVANQKVVRMIKDRLRRKLQGPVSTYEMVKVPQDIIDLEYSSV